MPLALPSCAGEAWIVKYFNFVLSYCKCGPRPLSRGRFFKKQAMTKKQQNLLIWGGVGILGIWALSRQVGGDLWFTLRRFISEWEKFSPTPYWDVTRYSWGYGTKAPGPTGQITQAQAWAEMTDHLENDYRYLKPLISQNLAPNQWAALLSFSYNLGPGNADNLIYNINSGNWSALETQWKQYIYVGGAPNNYQIKRRAAEWELFTA